MLLLKVIAIFSVSDENNSNSDCNYTVQTVETVGDKDELEETSDSNLYKNRLVHLSSANE
jgi:hypothetical protein